METLQKLQGRPPPPHSSYAPKVIYHFIVVYIINKMQKMFSLEQNFVILQSGTLATG